MTALADVRVLVADWEEDVAWDLHARLAELGVDTPDDPCPACSSLLPHPFECGQCMGRTCEPHDNCRTLPPRQH